MIEIYRPNVLDFESTKSLFLTLQTYLIDRIIDTTASEGLTRIALDNNQSLSFLYKSFTKNVGLNWKQVQIFEINKVFQGANNFLENELGKDFLNELNEFVTFEEKNSMEVSLKDYQQKLEVLDGSFFDMVVLHPHNDGSIGGLFSNGNYLKHQEKAVIFSEKDKDTNQPVLTLTIESLLNSSEVILILTNENRSYLLNEILEGKESSKSFPAKFLLAHPSLKIFYLR
jgi:6-phosphogluconolactonase/glucosamine-6-phosphate isomerase/deaminase